MLVDNEGNITNGFLKGKFLENNFIDSVTVNDNEFIPYSITSEKGTKLENEMSFNNDEKISTVLDIDTQVLGSITMVEDSNGVSWNEVLTVYNNKFIYGYIPTSDILVEEIVDSSEDVPSEVPDDTVNGNEIYVVNIHVPLNVRVESNTLSEAIDKLPYSTEVTVIKDVEPKYEEDIKWVYISFNSTVTGELTYGWVAEQIFSTNENYIVPKSEFVYEEPTEKKENSLDITEKDILSKSAVVLDVNTGQILFTKDISTKREIASITKILSAYIVLKYGNLDDTISYSKRAISVDEHKNEGYSTNTPEVAYLNNKIWYVIRNEDANEKDETIYSCSPRSDGIRRAGGCPKRHHQPVYHECDPF